MAFKVSRKKGVNVMRIGMKIVGTVIGLWVSGYLLSIVGGIMEGTCSAFYGGLTIIGWTMNNTGDDGTTCTDCCVHTTNGSGILSVIGILAVVWILFEFVNIRM